MIRPDASGLNRPRAAQTTGSAATPMMAQYRRVKAAYPDCLVMFRLGDFYELFDEDARVAAPILDIALTSREAGKGNRLAMCGVPYHAADSYVRRLVEKGYKVALCDQTEDPRQARGLVRRDVVRVVTPGTLAAEAEGPSSSGSALALSNYLVALLFEGPLAAGLAAVDLGTGRFVATEGPPDRLASELTRLAPSECLCREEDRAYVQHMLDLARLQRMPVLSLCDSGLFRPQTADEAGRRLAGAAASAAVTYLRETQKALCEHVGAPEYYTVDEFMVLDATARRNLELARSLSGARKPSLLGLLDRTRTPMGARTLAAWLEQPSTSVAVINTRLDAVEELVRDTMRRESLTASLKGVSDLERLASKLGCGSAGPRDLVMLRRTLDKLPAVGQALEGCASRLLAGLEWDQQALADVAALIGRAVSEDAPASARDPGVIASGYDPEVDRLRAARAQGTGWIAAMEAEERERTRIKSLKIAYNQVFGYYIEVSKPNLHLVPPDYQRKQTLSNGERFTCPRLRDYETLVLESETRLSELEFSLFCEVRERAVGVIPAIKAAAAAVGLADAVCSLAQAAVEMRYVRPVVTQGDGILIKAGRHPVVEASLGPGEFVPNDTALDPDRVQVAVVTGPNMAGKSTYLRQVALIVIMAQAGSFVPAESATIGVVDRVFTRIGASDDVAGGRSTFMVEMTEVAEILARATRKSLILLDEVGRGTSTYDGVSIAWAVAEYLHDRAGGGPKTLLATHFHELTQLEKTLERARNFSVKVEERDGRVVFLRRIVPGPSDRSYGIEVARLAGLPGEVIRRAAEVLQGFEDSPSSRPDAAGASVSAPGRGRSRRLAQLGLFRTGADAVVRELRGLDLDNMTPVQALATLARLKELARQDVLLPAWGGDASVEQGPGRSDQDGGEVKRRAGTTT